VILPAAGDTRLLAHGIGGREDLPIPFSYALLGAVIVLVVSFLAVGLLWRTPRLDGARAGRPLPPPVQTVLDSPPLRIALRLLGLAATAYVAVAAVFGPDVAANPVPGVVYVLFWVGLVPLSLLFGPVWRLVNPLRTLHLLLARVLRTAPEQGLLPYPAWLGYWPAAVGLLAFAWLELVAPDNTTVPVLRTFFLVYAGLNLLAAAVFGSRWFDRGDGFEVYSTLVGRLSPLGRRADGRLVLRAPLQGLDTVPVAPGVVATVCVVLGTTAFDGLSNAPSWVRFVQSGVLGQVSAGTFGLLGCVAAFAAAYLVAALLSGRLSDGGRRSLPRLFAHSVVPIAVGYVVAHYFSLLLFEGQRTLMLLSDPLVNGANVFGTAERGVDFTLASPATIAVVQVVAVVIGHVIGVVSAHDRAVRLFPRRQAVRGQLPLLLLMVGYTLTGLTLLFAA
jgi:hypothetical protein